MSQYDPSRPTVGKIYRDLQMLQNKTPIEVGDMSREMMKGLVEDINDGLKANPYQGKPYYLMIHEKKDLQMKCAHLRRVIFFPDNKRPWPEDDTTVFWTDPRTQEVRFCWSLPHWSEMDDMLRNSELYQREMIEQIKAWKAYDMKYFGFYIHPKKRWQPNPKHKDRLIEKDRLVI